MNRPPFWKMDLRTAVTLLLFAPGLLQAQWTALPDWPGSGFDGGYAFVLDDQVYVGFGQQLQRYDPPTNTWTTQASFPGAGADRKWANAFVIDGLAYVGMGIVGNSTFQTDLWAYDPVSDSWSVRASLPAAARGGSATFTLQGKGYVCGGTSTGPTFSEVFEYHPLADSWTQVSDLPTGPRGFPAAFVLNGKGYVYGGYQSGFTNETMEVHRFDPLTSTWEQVADLPGPGRQSSVAAVVGGTPIVAMGHTAFTLGNDDLYAYDPGADAWTLITQFPGGDRVYPIGAAVGGTFYLGTGNTFSFVPQKDWWAFDLGTAVKEAEGVGELVLAPNPASDVLTLQIPGERLVGQPAVLMITDASGRLVRSETLVGSGRSRTFSVAGLPAGCYIVSLTAVRTRYRARLLVR